MGPRQVTMAELDPGVMAAVREHMPSVCEGALDSLEGPRHRIVVGDALKYLEQQAQLVRRGHSGVLASWLNRLASWGSAGTSHR